MSDYLVLARKYRSATFDEVVGQDHVAVTLKNAITTGRVAHAFLFTGTRGVGKTTMARILAKALNCLSVDQPTPDPCNKCEACVAIARGDDMDVIEIDGASNRGIDEIRQLRSNAIYRPARCRYKIYYIDEVHMLTREAFNALLKTLEEPPAHVKFIFATTEPEKLPATIVSRCQRFDFRNIPTGMIAAHLEKICKSEEVEAASGAIFRIARAAAGSMRDGLSLLDQLLAAGEGEVQEQDVVRLLGAPPDERTASIVARIVAGEPAGALEGLDKLLASGVSLASATAAIGEMFRHMMLAAACGPDSDLIELPDSQKKTVAGLSEKLTLPVLVQAVSICQQTARGLRGLISGRGIVEAALVRLAAADKFVDAASLIERLEQLGPGGASRAGPPARAAQARPARPAGEKKKPVAGARQAVEQAAPPAQAPLENPRWEGQYVKDHWDGLVATLARDRAGHVSGLLAPAKVLSLRGETLRLGYDESHEPIRRRCAERMDGQIAAALGKLFGREVRCEYVPTGAAGESIPQQPQAALSTAERAELNGDPAVKAVLDFFDGSITNIRRQGPPADQVKETEQ